MIGYGSPGPLMKTVSQCGTSVHDRRYSVLLDCLLPSVSAICELPSGQSAETQEAHSQMAVRQGTFNILHAT